MNILKITTLLFAVILVFSPLRVFACACCSERGEYFEGVADFDGFAKDELKKLKFETSVLYSDAGYPDSIVGIEPLGAITS